jgi:Mn-dependent DtxR family transcriptional regulator
MDQIFTKQVVNRENVLREFFVNVIGDENDDTGEEST